MKKSSLFIILIIGISCLFGCQSKKESCEIAATTRPVYEFTSAICEGTDLTVCQIVTQNVSCLHNYTLQSSQMRLIESAETVVISGAGLEEFLDDPLSGKKSVIDASKNMDLICPENDHDHQLDHNHTHEHDPHIWLSPVNAKMMVMNICEGLSAQYPEYAQRFAENRDAVIQKLDTLQEYGSQTLSDLSCRELITFHDGFSYFADAFGLRILKAVEEESGSEASASELKELILLVMEHHLPAIFTEISGSEASAETICAETGAGLFALDMAMSDRSYFDAMYYNINTVKEALE